MTFNLVAMKGTQMTNKTWRMAIAVLGTMLAAAGALARRARARAVRTFAARDWIAAHARLFESLAAERSA